MIKEKIPQISIFILVILLVIGFVNASDVNETNIHDNAIDNNLNKNLPDYTKSTNNQNNPVLIIDTIKDTHYTDNVSVSGSLKDNNGKYLKDSSVNFNINGANYKNVTNDKGQFNLNYKTRIVGKSNVTVSFNENNNLKVSTTTSFVVTPQLTKISLNNITNTTYGDSVHINGKYTDKNNVILRSTPIIITINNQKFVSYTDNKGVYSLSYKTKNVGINNISVCYPGNVRYYGNCVNTTFNVIPKNTIIKVDDISSCQYTDYTHITGKYTDSSGNNLRYTPLILTYCNTKMINRTNDEGAFSFKLKATQPGKNHLNIAYPGNERYKGANVTKTFTVYAKDTIITLNKINTTEYSDYVIISGKYTDKNGNKLRYTPLNIEVNKNRYLTKTDSNGLFNYKLKANTVGINNGNISFIGNARYNATKKSLSFKVNPKSTKIQLNPSTINNSILSITGRFTDTSNYRLKYTPLNLKISYENRYVKSNIIKNTVISTDADGYFKYNFKINEPGVYSSKVSFNGNPRYCSNTSEVKSIKKGTSNIFVNSLQGIVNRTTPLEVNVTDELNNSITGGKINLYLNNKLLESKVVNSSKNILNIPKQNVGLYDIKVVYSSEYYNSSSKVVKLNINPNSNYKIKLIWNPAITHNLLTKISAHVRNKNNNNTLNAGLVKFYLNNNYLGSDNVKNNLSYVRFNVTYASGSYTARVDYYNGGKFIGRDSDVIFIRNQAAQIKQETFISLSSDLINNSKISGTKKDVYFAMDRTTNSKKDYSANDMKIMNGIASTLRANGFNVKTIRNGPSETYNTARYMYNNNVKNSICFILCNGVDANVIREYLYGNDPLLTTVRKRGNDIVMGWFYGAGNIYDSDGEYYYYLKKAWDDNYSGKGGISNPRRTMERDGIKIIYERNDLTGRDVANSFIRLYGGKVTEKLEKNSVISLKSVLYNTNNNRITSGNIVYTLNGKVIKNVTVTGNSYVFRYRLPNIGGTYNLKATYYLNNKVVCNSWNRYIKLI